MYLTTRAGNTHMHAVIHARLCIIIHTRSHNNIITKKMARFPNNCANELMQNSFNYYLKLIKLFEALDYILILLENSKQVIG